MKICFFNHYHNGDCFASKGFVTDLMRQLPVVEYSYAHQNHQKLLGDLGITCLPIPKFLKRELPFMEIGDTFYINTWIGCYAKDIWVDYTTAELQYVTRVGSLSLTINMQSYHKIWGYIYGVLNGKYGLNLSIISDLPSMI